MQPTSNKVSDWCIEHFDTLERSLNGSRGGALHQVKKLAFDKFKEAGIPTTKDEAWKYTNLSEIENINFGTAEKSELATSSLLKSYLPVGMSAHALVFVNGFYSEELSKELSSAELPEGVLVESLAATLKREDEELISSFSKVESSLASFNTALFTDGAYISVPEGVQAEEPIQLVFVTSPDQKQVATYPRVYLDAGKNSKVSLVESYIGMGEGGNLTNSVMQIRAEAGAQVDHVKVQLEPEASYHIYALHTQQKENSNVSSVIYTFGGGLVRNEAYPVLDGEHAETTIDGLTVVGNSQHVDNYTVIDHAEPNCQSNELFKGIYGGKSRGVFSGTIIVRQKAQKTNAIQSNNSILLSDDASIETRPQLKIWADDVKCTHGATVGQLDEEALFYLRSRGLTQAQARQILIRAFAGDLLGKVESEQLREFLVGLVQNRLEKILDS